MARSPDPTDAGPGIASSQRGKPRRPLVIAGVVAAALLVLLLMWDWNWYKGPIQAVVQAQTGRDFRIGGDLDVSLGRVTTISAEALRFGNAEWSKHPTMASADRIEIEIEVVPLVLLWQLRIPEIRLAGPDVRLESRPEGDGNWAFMDGDGDGDLPFRRLWIDDGRLRFADGIGQTDVDIAVDSAQPGTEGGAPPIMIDGSGTWKGNDFKISGQAESPLELGGDEPYRINLKASAGPTRASARGQLVNPFALRTFDLQLALSGQDLEDLYPLLGIALPETPPYQFDGRLSREGETWRYRQFTGTVGDSDLGGDAEFQLGGERPRLVAQLKSDLLDLDDLSGFLGAPAQSGPGETSNAEQAREAAGAASSGRVLPQRPYDLERLRSMDADVRLQANRINAPGIPLDDMDAHLLLEDGVLRLDPLDFGLADGEVRSTIRMDARNDVIRTRANATARRLSLGKLLPAPDAAKDAIGSVGGTVALEGSGNSIAAMLGSANGEVALGMGKGQVSSLLIEMAGLDILGVLKYLITGDKTMPVRCAFGDFAVKDGVMEARALAFDTQDTIIVGEGRIDLGEEAFDLELRPRPKGRSILTLRSPLVLDGSFKDPSIRPDMKRLGLRGAVALALGTVAPPAALLATFEAGPGEDADCGGTYAR